MLLLSSIVSGLVLGLAQEKPEPAPEGVMAVQPMPRETAGAKTWWMKRHREKLEQVKTGEPIDLVLVGDSITHGWDNTGKDVWEKHFGDTTMLNLGFSGDRTENVLWRLQNSALDGVEPKLVIVMIGTNNAGHRKEDPAHTALGIRAVVDELTQRTAHATILLLEIFPRGAKADDPLRLLNEKTNRRIASITDENERVVFKSLKGQFCSDDGELKKDLMPDALHPNAAGYEVWAKAMKPWVDQLMKEGK